METSKLSKSSLAQSIISSELAIRRNLDLIKNDFSLFVAPCFRTLEPGRAYKHNWHIDAIAEALKLTMTGEIRQLVINMPPRSLKTKTVSTAFSAFLLGQNPNTQIMASSYVKSLQEKCNDEVKQIMMSHWYRRMFPETVIRSGANKKDEWYTTSNGMRLAVGTGGKATGYGGDYLICDDPLNPLQAVSDTMRLSANEWYEETWSSRLNEPSEGRMILVMQRLHENDVTGMVLEKKGVVHLNLPAETDVPLVISVGGFYREMEAGELMHPDRLSREVLDRKRLEMGEYAYAGQYLQEPVPKGGGILKLDKWQRWGPSDVPIELIEPPFCDQIIQSVDTAFKETEEADYSARTTWGLFRYRPRPEDFPDFYTTGLVLLEAWHGRVDYQTLKQTIYQGMQDFQPDKILIEDKASGQSLIQDFKRMNAPIEKVKRSGADGDKVYRANIASSVLDGGCIWYMPGRVSNDVMRECARFPRGTNDDWVDTCTQAWIWFRNHFWIGLPHDTRMHSMPADDTTNNKPKNRRLYGGKR